MVRDFKELENIRNVPELADKFMEIMDFMFTKSQENLVISMPWGDKDKPSQRSPTVITDQSGILLSGVPPHWIDDNTIMFEYTAPHAMPTEFGSPPHPVLAATIIKWVNRKLRLGGKKGISAGYAIANTIKKKGIPPHPFIRPSIEMTKTKFNLRPI